MRALFDLINSFYQIVTKRGKTSEQDRGNKNRKQRKGTDIDSLPANGQVRDRRPPQIALTPGEG